MRKPIRILRRIFAVRFPPTILCVACLGAPAIADNPPQYADVSPASDADIAGNPELSKGFMITDVDGVVQTADGKPFAGARVTWRTLNKSDNNQPATITDAQGRFHFDGKAVWTRYKADGHVLVEAPGYALAGDSAYPATGSISQRFLKITIVPGVKAKFKLVTPQGQPVAGVRIRIRDESMIGFPPVPPLEFAGDLPDCFQSVSDADGMATLSGLYPGALFSYALDDPRYVQLVADSQSDKLPDTGDIDVKTIKLTSACSIEGTIVYADGKPASEIPMFAQYTDDNAPEGQAVSDKNGHFVLNGLSPGRYRVFAELSPALKRDWVAHDVTTMVAEGEPRTGLNLTLIKGVFIKGRVTYKGGKPAENIRVSVTSRGSDRIIDRTYVTTDANGVYGMRIVSGNLEVVIHASSDMEYAQTLKDNDGEVETLDLVMGPPVPPILPAPPVVVNGIVVDKAGKPVAGAEVSGITPGYYDSVQDVRSSANGKFAIPVKGGPIVFLEAREGSRATEHQIPAVIGDNVTLQLTDNAIAKIAGKVVDMDGKPIAGAEVTMIKSQFRTKLRQATTVTDAAGDYQITGVSPGFRYFVRGKAKGYRSEEISDLLPGPGETVDGGITLKPLNAYVAGRVVDSYGTPLINARVTSSSDPSKQVFTDIQGNFRIDGVAPGEVGILVDAGKKFGYGTAVAGRDVNIIRTKSLATEPPGAAVPADAVVSFTPIRYDQKEIPDFTVPGSAGAPISMAGLNGRFIIFDLWGGSSDHLSDTQMLAQQFASRSVVAVGLNESNDSLKGIQERITKEHITIPIGMDADHAVEKSLGASGIEIFVIVDTFSKTFSFSSDFSDLTSQLGNLLH